MQACLNKSVQIIGKSFSLSIPCRSHQFLPFLMPLRCCPRKLLQIPNACPMALYPRQSTPFPNALIDTVLPTLKDTEWRLLCVLVRQTLGFYDPATRQRRETVWLSHTQLKTRTGRSSEAISHALEVLVQRQLIVVTSADGALLSTAEERRRCPSGLHFRVCACEQEGEGPECRNLPEAAVKSENNKRNRNKNSSSGWHHNNDF